MTEEITFISPDGNAIQGAVQIGTEDHWRVIWGETVDGYARLDDYAGEGPDAGNWETVEIGDDVLYIDATGDYWLGWHLIRDNIPFPHPETGGLSPETCRLLALDLAWARAFADANSMCDTLDSIGVGKAMETASLLASIDGAAREIRESASKAKAADLAICMNAGWHELPADDEPAGPVDIVAKAEEGVEHLRKARECFRAAGSRRTLERVDAALSSGKGAVRAAGYRQNRLEEEARVDVGERVIAGPAVGVETDHLSEAEFVALIGRGG